jgi:fatty acid desaturase
VGFVVNKVAFGFLWQFSFHRLLHNHHHHLSSRAGTTGQLVADVPSGLSLTPPQEIKNITYRYSFTVLDGILRSHSDMELPGEV